MATIAQATDRDVGRLAEELSGGLRSRGSFAEAAQWFACELADRFPSIVLARVFATVPHSRLPQPERDAAASAAAGVALFPATEVLTLFGSAGVRPEWNDRRRSRGHLAIPLVSRAHVDDIPMVSRLLSDLRFRLDDDPHPSPFVTRAFANANGLFYIPDAETALDHRGRKIVPAADFVREHGVRSVFGFGGSYVIQRMFVSTIVFTRETIEKSSAMNFLQLSSAYKAGTTRLVSRGLLFDGDAVATSNG